MGVRGLRLHGRCTRGRGGGLCGHLLAVRRRWGHVANAAPPLDARRENAAAGCHVVHHGREELEHGDGLQVQLLKQRTQIDGPTWPRWERQALDALYMQERDKKHHLQTWKLMVMDLVIWPATLVPVVFPMRLFRRELFPLGIFQSGTTLGFKRIPRGCGSSIWRCCTGHRLAAPTSRALAGSLVEEIRHCLCCYLPGPTVVSDVF